MPTEEPPRLWFELSTGSDPIAGQMHADGNPSRSFHSWLELVALIEEMRAERPEPTPTDRNDEKTSSSSQARAARKQEETSEDKLPRRTGRSPRRLRVDKQAAVTPRTTIPQEEP